MNARHPTEHVYTDCDGGSSFRPIRGALYLLWSAIRVSVWIRFSSARFQIARCTSNLFIAWTVAGASLGIAATVIVLVLWWDAIKRVVVG